ncbi:hypothetical protein GGR50DRAFT_692835 [Xylaria sp. CBS 124048]|nr:hypothetical protein GGR50DRAFT_692835 [Xylaria sp. CBS 124048]
MLPSTVRRMAAAAPQSPLLTTFAPTATRASTALTLNSNPRCNQRRRYSSSKPSNPNDSPNGVSDRPVTTNAAQSTKQSGEKRRRKTKDSSPHHKLPSVPSTQDMPQEALALSTFFSLHRPISVTHSFPKAITDDAFAQIFAPRTKSSMYNKVVSTLARAVSKLEQPMQGLNIATQHAADAPASHDLNNTSTPQMKNADGSEPGVYLQLDHMSGQFLPFRPPPIPQPVVASESASAESESTRSALSEEDVAATQHQPQTRVYKAVFTLEETIDEDGNARIVAHSPQLVAGAGSNSEYVVHNPPRSFLERMALREIKREQARGGHAMYAISVKRQRKLKMKKKKYKKLMKKTRNLRRKLDRV